MVKVTKNGEKKYATFTVDSLEPGESYEFTQAIEIAVDDFSDLEIIDIKVDAYCGEEDC